jgi:outer membrane receptor protein involved in Fe transport
MKSLLKFSFLVVPLLMLLTATALYPQGGLTSAISGFVTDPSGAPVAAVNVKATNVNTGVSYSAGTTTDGYYTIKFVIPGTYRVEVRQAGFKDVVVNNVGVDTAANPTVNIKLELGAVAQTVTVTDKTSMLEMETADSAATIDTPRVIDTPTMQRNSFELAYSSAGLLPTSTDKTMTLEDITKSSSQSINGGEPSGLSGISETNDVLIDGVEDRCNYLASGSTNSQISEIPSQEAVGEVKVVTNPYSAEYGRTTGGAILFETKTGTNQFHGQAFEYNRSHGLSAATFDNNLSGAKKSALLFNTPGGEVAGPILKNKLFFFGSYELMLEHLATLEYGTVPTAAQRQGDFTSTYYNAGTAAAPNLQPITLYNPFSCTSSTTTCTSRSVIGSVGDSSLPAAGIAIDPVATALWNYIPMPNAKGDLTGGFNYFPSGGYSIQRTYEFVSRVDYNLSSSTKLTFRAIRENWTSFGLHFYNTANDAAEVAGSFPSTRANHNDLIDYTHTFSPTSVLDIRLGMEHATNDNLNSPIGCQVSPAKLGFSSTYVSQAYDCMPVFNFAGPQGTGTDLGGNDAITGAGMGGDGIIIDQINTLSAMYLKSLGQHTLKFGGLGIMERGYSTSKGDNSGQFTFSSQSTQQAPSASTLTAQGNPVASFEMGVANSAALTIASAPARQNLSYGWFVQDDIKVSRKLTINAGLRWDWNGGLTDRFNAMTGAFNPTVASPLAAKITATTPGYANCPACASLVGGLTFPGVGGLSRSPYDSTFTDFGPRLGAAYAITPNTVVRAGWGLFYSDWVYDPGTSGFTATTAPGLFSGTYQVDYTLDNIFAGGLTTPTGSSLGLSTLLGSAITYDDPHTRQPRAQQFNFNVQRQLTPTILMTVGYNYNGIARLPVSLNLDHLTLAQIQQEGSLNLNTGVTNPFAGTLNGTIYSSTSLNKSTVSLIQLLYPYPEFSSVTETDIPIGNSSFHALEVQITKRFGGGLSSSLSYTNSKHMDRTAYMNAFDTQLMKEIDQYDTPQSLTLNGVYEFPFGRGKHFASGVPGYINQVIGGWQFNFLTRIYGGQPFSFNANAAPVPGVPVYASPKTIHSWFNPNAFVNVNTTAFCYPGNQAESKASSNSCIQEWSTNDSHIRTPRIANFDLSLYKSFNITERVKFVVMTNWINATNTPQFLTPSTQSVTSSTFGGVDPGGGAQTNQPRQIQMAGKITF